MISKFLVLLVFSSLFSPANAAEDTKFLWQGEYRSRGLVQENILNTNKSRNDIFSHRLMLNAEFEPNDRLDAVVSGLVFQNWGDDIRGYAGVREESDANTFRIYQAYGEWHLSTAFFLKFGRWGLDFGNGALVSKNLDDSIPYSLDGVMLGYDSSNFELRLGGLRVGDWSSGLGFSADPDSSAYFALVNLKSLEPAFKFFQIYFFREQKDAFANPVTTTSILAESSNHFGVSAAGEYKKAFYELDYVQYSGEFTDLNTNIDGFMTHVKLGFNLREKKALNLFLVYHYDTGDEDGSADLNEAYRPLFYNHHKYAGVMDLLGWGNLNYYGLGIDYEPSKESVFRLQALSFARTSEADGPKSISFQGFGESGDFIDEDVAQNTNNVASKDLGLEIDFIYERAFESGMNMEVLAGIFMPGSYFESYQRGKDIYGARLTLSLPF